jgi:hypothetical protein
VGGGLAPKMELGPNLAPFSEKEKNQAQIWSQAKVRFHFRKKKGVLTRFYFLLQGFFYAKRNSTKAKIK